MRWIITLLRTIAPTLSLIQFALKNFDQNEEGVDDKIATLLADVNRAIEALLSTFPEDDEVAPVRGYEAIRAYCLNALATIDLVIANPKIPVAEKVKTVKEIMDSLNDRKIIYQAKRGADGKFLTASKLDAQRKYNIVIRMND